MGHYAGEMILELMDLKEKPTMTQLPLTPPKRTLRKLSAGEMFKLTLFVQAEYTKSGLTDKAFAEKAGKFLEFECSPSSVATARESLGLESNRDLAREEKKATGAISADLGPLEKRLDTLEAQVRKLFSLTSREIALTKIPSDNQIIKLRAELYQTHSAESGDFRAIELVRRILRGEF
jgi:hypothetical protein